MTWAGGETTDFYSGTEMYIPTLSIGVKEFFHVPTTNISLYLGIGFSAAVPYTHTTYEYSPKDIVRFSPGIVLKSGFLLIPRTRITRELSNLVLDLFFDYYIQPTTQIMNAPFKESLTDIGGFRTGGGLGYLF